jgi:hypothetical protein
MIPQITVITTGGSQSLGIYVAGVPVANSSMPPSRRVGRRLHARAHGIERRGET